VTVTQSLTQLWDQTEGDLYAEYADGDVVHVIARRRDGDFMGLVVSVKTPDASFWRAGQHLPDLDGQRAEWKLWIRPVAVEPHWQAVCLNKQGQPFLTPALYPDDTTARAGTTSTFLRLARELPAVMLEVVE
jgi:hypothetical protein